MTGSHVLFSTQLRGQGEECEVTGEIVWQEATQRIFFFFAREFL